eukprot:1915956-Rhodomonas_salina.2
MFTMLSPYLGKRYEAITDVRLTILLRGVAGGGGCAGAGRGLVPHLHAHAHRCLPRVRPNRRVLARSLARSPGMQGGSAAAQLPRTVGGAVRDGRGVSGGRGDASDG